MAYSVRWFFHPSIFFWYSKDKTIIQIQKLYEYLFWLIQVEIILLYSLNRTMFLRGTEYPLVRDIHFMENTDSEELY